MNRLISFGMLILMVLFFQTSPVLANKSGVTIEGPTQVAKGTEVTLRLMVTHSANSSSHHTEWLKVAVNKKEAARWDYTKDNLPAGADFVQEFKIKIMEDTEVTAEASCNKHGSKGPAIHKITVK